MTDQDDNAEVEPDRHLSLHQFVTYRMARVQAKLNAQAIAILGKHAGLTLTQWRVLALIGTMGQTQSSEIARRSAMDKGLISRTTQALIAMGLIRSDQDDEDARVQHLRLTRKGRDLFRRILPHMTERQVQLRAALTPEENEILLVILDKLELAAEYRAG